MTDGESRPDADRDERSEVVLRDPRAIRALAHPARLAVIEELFRGRTLTATECAERAGLTASAMSYHLRALERWGIVTRAESRDGRERPWRAAGRRLRVESTSPRLSGPAETAFVHRLLERDLATFDYWLAGPAGEDPRWRDAVTLSRSTVEVTVDELELLLADLERAQEPYARRAPADGGAATSEAADYGTRRVRLVVLAFPAAD